MQAFSADPKTGKVMADGAIRLGQSSRVGLLLGSMTAGMCQFWSGGLGAGICAPWSCGIWARVDLQQGLQ